MARFSKSDSFFKVDGKIAYGWAIVSTIDGKPYFDLHGDHIPDDAMTDAAEDFMKNFRVGKDQHDGDQCGHIVFAFPVTKANKPAVDIDSNKTGLLIGYQFNDAAMLEMIKSGQRTGFSIGGFLESADLVEKSLVPSDILTIPEQALTKNVRGALLEKASGSKRIFRSFKIREISIVDRPAQEPALIGLVKKAPPLSTMMAKQAVLTEVTEGHQHLLDPCDLDSSGAGRTSYASKVGEDYGHDHAWVVVDGKIKLSLNEGHTHEVDVPADSLVMLMGGAAYTTIALSAPQNPNNGILTDKIPTDNVSNNSKEPTQMDIKDQEIASLKAQLAKSMKLVELTDAEKQHLNSLPDYARDSWLNKSAHDRSKDVEVVYTTHDGIQLRRSHGEVAIEMAKRADQAIKAQKEAADGSVAVDIAKRAPVLLKSYPGEDNAKALLLKAVEGIADSAAKTAALAMIAAGEAALSKGFQTHGTDAPKGDATGANTGTPQVQFDALVAKRMTEAKEDLGRATLHVMKNEGRDLYKAMSRPQ